MQAIKTRELREGESARRARGGGKVERRGHKERGRNEVCWQVGSFEPGSRDIQEKT